MTRAKPMLRNPFGGRSDHADGVVRITYAAEPLAQGREAEAAER
ncbi:hypothetical protein ACIRPU_33140 [Streptomyces sp. NPDC102259]